MSFIMRMYMTSPTVLPCHLMTYFIVHIGIFPWTPASESAGRLRRVLPHQRRQPQEVRKAKQGPPLSQILIRVASAQVGPFNGDTKKRPIPPLKKNPLLFLQSPAVQENESFPT